MPIEKDPQFQSNRAENKKNKLLGWFLNKSLKVGPRLQISRFCLDVTLYGKQIFLALLKNRKRNNQFVKPSKASSTNFLKTQ